METNWRYTVIVWQLTYNCNDWFLTFDHEPSATFQTVRVVTFVLLLHEMHLLQNVCFLIADKTADQNGS